jgi:hypothetical protein
MPDIFKALATVGAWVLFLCGMVMGFSAFIVGVINRDLWASVPPPMEYSAMFAAAGFYALAAVVIMILRKKMEK